MTYDTHDTIVAPASAPGGAARGIVRLSGDDVHTCLAACFRPSGGPPSPARCVAHMIPGFVHLAGEPTPLDAILYNWPAGRSYTRQPLAELHVPGSPPLVAALVRTLCVAGARLAEPGEFTLRAFLAGRIDLTRAEAVLAVVDAVERDELRVALRQLAGGLSGPLDHLRDELLDLLADVEAGLDFVEEHIEFVTAEEIERRLAAACNQLDELAQQMTSRGAPVEGLRVVLAGAPNVGKSSLFNALVDGARALVADVPGTTRDYLTAALDLDGVPIELIDTAGLEANGPAGGIAAAARSLTGRQHAEAHVMLVCLDSTRALSTPERAQLAAFDNGARRGARRLVAWTKVDARRTEPLAPAGIETSAHRGTGLDTLRGALRAAARSSDAARLDVVRTTAARSAQSIHRARDGLKRAGDLVADQAGEELVADELRLALDALGQVTGAVYADDVLDRIFSRFCIGK